jgi:RimJ/RimL family protein N-acetyltransferase
MDFETSQHITLENNRVSLRPLRTEDSNHLTAFSMQEPELWKYSLLPANGLENLNQYISIALEKRALGDSYPFIVFDKKTNAFAGSTRFYDIQNHHKSVQLGYTWYGKAFQRKGLNRHCKFLMLEFAFETLNVERVEFRADANNARSIVALQGIGCTVEGILRNNCSSPAGRRNSIVLSILKDEWFKDVRESLKSKLL